MRKAPREILIDRAQASLLIIITPTVFVLVRIKHKNTINQGAISGTTILLKPKITQDTVSKLHTFKKAPCKAMQHAVSWVQNLSSTGNRARVTTRQTKTGKWTTVTGRASITTVGRSALTNLLKIDRGRRRTLQIIINIHVNLMISKMLMEVLKDWINQIR